MKVLLFVVWCLVAFCNHGWVSSIPIGQPTCNSGNELWMQMTDVSDTLKYGESFINIDLRQTVDQLIQAMTMAPPQLVPVLNDLKAAAVRIDVLGIQLSLNATDAVSNSTGYFVESDKKIVKTIDHDPSYFNDPTRLGPACALIDNARNASQNFTENIAKRYQQMKLAVMPNETEILAKFAELTRILGASDLIDVAAAENEIRVFIQQIQRESDHIEQNLQPEKYKFRKDTDQLAFDVEWQMKIALDGIYKMLPDEWNLTLEPKCDSPEHLKKRLFKMTDNLSDAYFVADFVPQEIVANLKSSILWASPDLKDSLSYLIFEAARYNKWSDDVVCNASTKIAEATNRKIISDYSLIEIVDDHTDLLRDTDKLNASCDLVEIARNITAEYKSKAADFVDDLMFALVPALKHFNEMLIILNRQIRLTDVDDVEKGNAELLGMAHEIEASNKNIEMNFREQLDAFGKRIDEMGLGADAKLKNLADKLRVVLQLPVIDASDADPPK